MRPPALWKLPLNRFRRVDSAILLGSKVRVIPIRATWWFARVSPVFRAVRVTETALAATRASRAQSQAQVLEMALPFLQLAEARKALSLLEVSATPLSQQRRQRKRLRTTDQRIRRSQFWTNQNRNTPQKDAV